MHLALSLSNRLEVLREGLLHCLANEAPGPFATQQVIVPSAAVRRHLELAIADRQGLCAGIEFGYLGQWLWRELARYLPAPERSPLDSGRVSWALWELLGDPALRARHPQLAHYLAQDDAVMRFELAERLAQSFDDVLAYRPHWAEAWRHGKPAATGLVTPAALAAERWQAELWQRLTAQLGVERQHPFLHFLAQPLPAVEPDAPTIHPTVHIFALPSIPPLQLALLSRLAQLRPIRLWAINPCREYWFELVDAKRLSWLAARGRSQYLETGNRLLAAWGKPTQANIDLLFASDAATEEHDSVFLEAGSASLLGALQDAVLDSRELEPGCIVADESLEFHVCHSLTRQLETLHDRLLALFAAVPDLQPAEILVALPDLPGAAPLIEGVFGATPATRRIPYAITGRPPVGENPVASTVLQLVSLIGGRFPVSELFELLQQAPVAARYQLDSDALEQIRGWILAARIRWGLDAEQRGAMALPPEPRFTLADGLERLLLAYAMGDEAPPFAGQLPAGDPEGSSALALGRFARFIDDLKRTQVAWQQAHDSAGWREQLQALLDRFIAPDFEWAEGRRALQAAISLLCDEMAAQRGSVPPAVVSTALRRALEQSARGGVPAGAVCFAPMSALRNLPYRVICVLGMDDGAYPGNARAPEFDLIAQAPQRGDRQRRHDDRNLFLDLLLAARERFLVFWSGRSQRDNAALPPSVLVSELLAVAAEACTPESAASLRIEHPLQPFAPALFDASSPTRQRSFNAEYCAALVATGEAQARAPDSFEPSTAEDEDDAADAPDPRLASIFMPAPLPPLDPAAREIGLDTLISFFRHPARSLLRERLGLRLAQAEDELEDDEPFRGDYDAERALAQRLLPVLLGTSDAAEALALADAGNEFPPGQLGALLREDCVDELRAFALRWQGLLDSEARAARPFQFGFELDGEAWQLSGQIGDLRANGLVVARFAPLSASDVLEAWLRHLCLNASAAPGVINRTRILARDAAYQFAPLDVVAARATLHELLSLYRDGQHRVLHFYPRSAWAWAQAGQSMAEARKKWECNARSPWGESGDAAWRLALRGVVEPLDAAFVDCARQVFEPLLARLEELAP